jgi:MoxR-like ATPase
MSEDALPAELVKAMGTGALVMTCIPAKACSANAVPVAAQPRGRHNHSASQLITYGWFMEHQPDSAQEVSARLRAAGYLPDEGLSTITYLALAMGRPLLLEGEPGTGKTALAEALATLLDVPLIRLQCYEGIDASQALYDWDFPRQILHLRAVEATSQVGSRLDTEALEASLFADRFLLDRPILRALREQNAVLLIDEIDRADDEFEAFLLEVLSTNQVTIPEYGVVRAQKPPVVVLTSNRTRELHDALKRRCLYHWIDHPGLAREVEIVRSRLPEVSQRLAEQVAGAVQRMRASGDLLKAPGVAETLDWAQALHQLGRDHLDVETASATLGAVLKYREDADRVRDTLDLILAG